MCIRDSEDVLQHLGWHPEAGVGDLHPGPLPVSVTPRGPRLEGAGHQGQRSTARHGIAAVHHEVHDELIELAWVCLDRAERLVERDAEFDLLAEQAPEHRHHVIYAAVEVYRPESALAAASKRQQLGREFGRARTCPSNLTRISDSLIDLESY